MKKRMIITVVLLCLVLATKAMAVGTFSDVKEGQWFANAVQFCAEKGYVSGYSDGTFKPNNTITRAEFAVIMNKMLGLSDPADNTFRDVPNGKWYTAPILNCVMAGIITGYSSSQFGPNDKVTREQAAVILAKAFGISIYPGKTAFSDGNSISGWAVGSVKVLNRMGLIAGVGKNSFNPKAPVTRSAACQIIYAKNNRLPGNTSEAETIVNVYESLPEEFTFSSGAGGWRTALTIFSDGSFIGNYYDGNPGSGPNYTSTGILCDFSGKLTAAEKIDQYTYKMSLSSLNIEGQVGSSYVYNNVLYTIDEPYGMDDAKQFYIYLPGKPIDELSEEFLGWVHLSNTSLNTLPSGFYGLYNQNGKEGFSGVTKDSIWYQSFAYENGSNRAELWPYYSGNSHIVFWKGTGASVLDITFPWAENSQTEFEGSDLNTGTPYDISLHFNDNNTSVQVTIKSNGQSYDMRPWGGSATGELSCTFTRKIQA